MKRLIIPGLALIAALALFHWGNRILEQTLDAELPPLLSRELGIPVSMAPTHTRISTLTVHTPRLVMGDPGKPALVATDVSVSLDWSDLLHGEIRLRRASGATLMVKPSLWPGNDDPWPADYLFLDPYLPDRLALDSASYVDADGKQLLFSRAQWRRQAPGATLGWQDSSTGRAVAITLKLSSLDQLLRLAEVKLLASTAVEGNTDSAVEMALDLRPAQAAGYQLTARLNAAGMTATVATGNSVNWKLPDQSSTTIEQLDIDKSRALIAAYRADSGDDSVDALLAQPLPRLSLPAHRGKVTIDEIRWQDEVGTNSAFEFVTGPEGVSVPALSSKGPEGTLNAHLDVTSSDSGWKLGLTAAIEAAATDKSLGAPYLDADWFWREGSANVTGEGDTWGELLNSLQGDIALAGSHHGAVVTPVTLTARLGNRPGQFALDTIEVKLGKGRITGSAALSGDARKRLSSEIRAEQLNLDFLLPPADPDASPGMALPSYLQFLPGVDMALKLEINAVSAGDVAIKQASASFTRSAEQAVLIARSRGENDSQLDLRLEATALPDEALDVAVRTDLSRFNFSTLFRQAPVFLDSRTSGTISFNSRGKGLEQIFTAMKGKAELSIDHRPDHDWQRPPAPEEELRVSGQAGLVMGNHKIMGLGISDLAVESVSQNLTGTVSIVEGRKPWLEVELTSDKLDLAALLARAPDPAAEAPEPVSLDALRNLGDSRFTLDAKSVLIAGLPLTAVTIAVSTAPDHIAVDQLDFSLGRGTVHSDGGISWHKDEATLALDARVKNFSLDKVLADTPSVASKPLSGTVSLHSTGDNLTSLLADLSGEIELVTDPAADSGARGEVKMTARQTADGMRAVVQHFLWEGSDLAGSVQYHATTPPLLEIEISGGSLSLLPWEPEETDAAKAADKQEEGSIISRTARASVDLVGDVVMAPLRLISGPREAQPGDKLFDTTPLPFDWMKKYQARIKGKLGKLTSREGTAGDVEFSASLLAGQLEARASAGVLNQGSADASITVDSTAQPAAVTLSGTFRNLRGGNVVKEGFPRSGYFDVSTRGQSQAELAANASGLVYLDLGAGPLDYSNMMLLTADVASNVFQTLIPGIEKAQPLLECGVTLGVFKDGLGTTPFGYAARTNQANLVGKVEIDLKKELIHMNFSSSSRKGLGLSVGNVFSNTIEIEGSITDPKIIPDTTGLLWRSWAAVLTGGLSVVGESVLKRALSSEDPCTSVQKHIHKHFCGTEAAAKVSPMVCPPA